MVIGLRDRRCRTCRCRSGIFCVRELHDARLRRRNSGGALATARANNGDERRAYVWLVDRRHIRGAAQNCETRRLNTPAIEGPIGLSLRHGRRSLLSRAIHEIERPVGDALPKHSQHERRDRRKAADRIVAKVLVDGRDDPLLRIGHEQGISIRFGIATYSPAMAPPPPGLFSTMKGCPVAVCSCWLNTRATTSGKPPGANGTTSFTARLG
jgi:hypothetical protein